MGRNKIAKFEQIEQNPMVVEPTKAHYEEMKGKWNSLQFEKEQPIVVELGCGYGEYTLGLSQAFPNKNFIGVDIKGDRIWMGSSRANELEVSNVAFLRTKIELIENFFAAGEIDEVWITFPDPRPKDRDIKRRLTSPKFLERYRLICKKEAFINFKTDNKDLFDYTLEVLEEEGIEPVECTHDLYNSPYLDAHHGIQTRFEKKFLGQGIRINYMKFKINN